MIKKVCCIGAGYVGGPTMSVFADKCKDISFNVVDVNPDRIAAWNSKDLSKLPIFEPGLDEIVKRCRGKNLTFSTEVNKCISEADMIFISVNTPTKTSGIGAGQASDLKWIEASARQISKYSKGHSIVVEKSTLPIKTAATIKSILETNKDFPKNGSETKSFSVLSNPEFLSEGTAINDLLKPDRVLIGGEDKNAISLLMNIYLNWIKKEKILTTNLWSSELSKLIANAFLAQRISSINSVSALCEKTGANINEVALAVGTDSRIGNKFLKAGPGFGGSCFKKDILNLIYICNHYGLHQVSNYWQEVLKINEWQSKRITSLITDKLFGTLAGKIITILGFSYKANTNDTRESPAIKVCKDLLEEGAILNIYDPKVNIESIEKELNIPASPNEFPRSKSSTWIYCEEIDASFINSDAIVILTEWEEFKNLDFLSISEKMRKPSWIFDTRSILKKEKINLHKINLWSIGDGSDL